MRLLGLYGGKEVLTAPTAPLFAASVKISLSSEAAVALLSHAMSAIHGVVAVENMGHQVSEGTVFQHSRYCTGLVGQIFFRKMDKNALPMETLLSCARDAFGNIPDPIQYSFLPPL